MNKNVILIISLHAKKFDFNFKKAFLVILDYFTQQDIYTHFYYFFDF